jgi:hypothetical protein
MNIASWLRRGPKKQVFMPPCSSCGAASARIELLRAGAGWRLIYSGPGGSNGASGETIAQERATAIKAAFAVPYAPMDIQAAGIYDDAGFCMKCGQFYCSVHWSVMATGGGRCPRGHFKSLDPHWSPD